MSFNYLLHIKGETLLVLRSDSDVKSESEFIDLLSRTSSKLKLSLISVQIRLLFEKLDSKSGYCWDWQNNLKTLLAHGLGLVQSSKQSSSKLEKSFLPLRFELTLNEHEPLHFGFFHTTSGTTPSDQFIEFCNASEYPTGINKHILTTALLQHGGQLIAHENEQSEVLVSLNISNGHIVASDPLFQFLSD